MIVVGLLVIALVALVLVGLVARAGGSTEAEFFGLVLPNLSARTLVLLGLALGVLLAVGWGIVRRSASRQFSSRRTRRDSQRAAAAESDEDPFLLGR